MSAIFRTAWTMVALLLGFLRVQFGYYRINMLINVDQSAIPYLMARHYDEAFSLAVGLECDSIVHWLLAVHFETFTIPDDSQASAAHSDFRVRADLIGQRLRPRLNGAAA